MREYLLHLAQEKKAVASTLLVNRAALKFLYVAILSTSTTSDASRLYLVRLHTSALTFDDRQALERGPDPCWPVLP